MIYKNHKINASAPDWHYFEVNEDGTIGDFIDNGGVNGEYEYEIYTIIVDEDDGEVEDDELVGGGATIAEAKEVIDQLIYDQTHFTEGISV